jgi:hypothetical protein
MVDPTSNDNEYSSSGGHMREPDAHGQAALLLVESLIHGLVSHNVISAAMAVEIVSVAAEVKVEVASENSERRATMVKSLALLGAMHASLSIDLPGDEVRPWPPQP